MCEECIKLPDVPTIRRPKNLAGRRRAWTARIDPHERTGRAMSNTATMSHNDQLIERTATLRRKAEELLAGLLVEQKQRATSPDALSRATGRSSMERAIQSAERMIATLDRTMSDLGQVSTTAGV